MTESPTKNRRPRWKTISMLSVWIVIGSYFGIRMLKKPNDAKQMDLPLINSSASADESPSKAEQAVPTPKTPVNPADLPLPDRITEEAISSADHPFDPLLVVAQTCLDKIDQEVFDYTATLSSQVRVDGTLQEARTLFCKIRHAKDSANDKSPFSVYTRFVAPESSKGQEAIWVDGWHEGNLVAHVAGFANVKRFYLEPTSSIAMSGNLHPIYDIGFRNLLVKMMEVGDKDRRHEECIVTVKKGLELDGRKCTMLQAMHPQKREHFEFHIARIYIDDELEFPLAYEGYLWPEEEGGDPVLLEKYYYTDVKINVGLKDIDFDPANEAYDYPSF